MALKVYQYAKCGTCRNALKWLQAQGIETELIPVFEEPPAKEQLTEMVKASGMPVKKFFNTSGEVYKEMQLKDKLPSMSEEEQIALLSSNGRLIKRPLAYDGRKVTIGFKPEQYEEVWGSR
ncbi:arsenate reductase family protein [Paenibacillus gansuensis]|uniref:Arsenate reductase family protein n=1 Tax=Paenibacillus gansuensis TaxID=306542 RepID=A0ABW5PI43_9BACL